MTDASSSQGHFDTRPRPRISRRSAGGWSGPGGERRPHGTVRYEWMDGGFFLIQHVELEQDGQQIKGVELIGHLRPFGQPPSQAIHSRFSDSTGNTLTGEWVYPGGGGYQATSTRIDS